MDEKLDTAALFEHKIQKYTAALFKSAYRLTGSRTEAEDLLQELLIKLYRQFPQWRDMDAPMPWLQRVLYNLHIDMYRKKAHTHGANASTVDAEILLVDTLVSASPSPQVEAEGAQRQRRILAALAELDPEHRALVTLHLIEGRTLLEVAAILDTPLGTLKSRLHRCKASLKKSLQLEPFANN